MEIATIEFVITILVFLGSLVGIWVSLSNKVEKIDTRLSEIETYKVTSEQLARTKFTELDQKIERKIDMVQIVIENRVREMREERKDFESKMEKTFEKMWHTLERIEEKLDDKIKDLIILKSEHDQNYCHFKNEQEKNAK
jgi:hypothetical protein